MMKNYHWQTCMRNATRVEDGAQWCKQHSPSAQKARNAASMARWQEQRQRDAKINALHRAAPALLAACEAVLDMGTRPLTQEVRDQIAAAVRAASKVKS